MVPANYFSFALAPAPLTAERSSAGPLTPTSPDYQHVLDVDVSRNEVASSSGSPYASSPCGYNSSYTRHSNPNYGYDSSSAYHVGSYHETSRNDNDNIGKSNNCKYLQSSNRDNGNNRTTNGTNQNNVYKTSGYNKTSGDANIQTGNGGNNNPGRKNSSVSCSSGSPVRGNYRHPSTPKSNCNFNGRGRDRSSSSVTGNNGTGYDVASSRTFRHLHGQQPHLVAKSVNGVTVMALPSPMMVTSGPTTMLNVSANDHQLLQGDFNAHIPPMTPPRTPVLASPTRRDNANNNKGTDPIMAIKKLSL